MIRCLLIEDEDLAAKKLERLLKATGKELEIVKRLASVEASISYLSSHQEDLDLIFLDIHLGDGSSFEIFDHVQVNTPIIFVTAYDQYAIRAFSQNSVDYLLKPIDSELLNKALEKFERYHKSGTPQVDFNQIAELLKGQGGQKLKDRFMVYLGSSLKSIPVQQVALFWSESGATFLTDWHGKFYDLGLTLEALIDQLDRAKFYRVNRKIIVHIDAIQDVYHFSKKKLKINLKPDPGFDVFVPLDKITAFKNWFGQ